MKSSSSVAVSRGKWILAVLTIAVLHTSHAATTQTSIVSSLVMGERKGLSFFVPRVTTNNEDDNDGTSSSHSVSSQHLSLSIPRGGGSLAKKEDDNAGFLVTKTRNIVRSLLEMLDQSSPGVGKLVRSLVSTMEQMLGICLLPSKPQKSSKKKKKKSSKIVEEDDDEKSTVSRKSKKKKRKSETSSSTVKSSTSTTPAKTPSSLSTSKKPKGNKASSSKTSQAMKKHMDAKLNNKHANYRIQRELKEFLKSPPPNLSVKVGSNIRVWIVTMKGASNTIYQGETFKLRISFPKEYPVMPPSVYFLPPHLPQHEHVYTNGDICLSLLGKGWRPTMTAQSIAVSILSILSSAQTKQLPMDNARHAQNKPGQYQKDWVYHDDNC